MIYYFKGNNQHKKSLRAKLKIAFLIPCRTVEAWQEECIRALKTTSICDVFILNTNICSPANIQEVSSSNFWNMNFYNLYAKIDYNLFKIKPDAFLKKSLDLTKEKKWFDIQTSQKDDCLYINYDNSVSFKDVSIDIIVNFTSKKIGDLPAEVSNIGILKFDFGDKSKGYGVPPGFWEVINKDGETGFELIMDCPNNEKLSLYYCTSLTKFKSVTITNNNFLWKAPTILAREIKKIHKHGPDEYKLLYTTRKINENYVVQLGIPTNFKMAFLALKMATRVVKEFISQRLFYKQWIILFNFKKEQAGSWNFDSFKRILPPKDRYWADPFIIKKNSKFYIFLEEILYSNKKGYISVMEIDEQGNYTQPVKAIEEDYHLSYPFLFEENGELYMIPESSQNKDIRLYKCLDFPYNWELKKVLMKDMIAVDSTILNYNNKYWMFTNMGGHEGTSTYDELFLFYADQIITDKWIPHPLNPIVTDVKNARPAGQFFWNNNKLYRPAQNCSVHYGYGIQINEVLELSETVYKERTVRSVTPDWEKDLIATHTLNEVNGLSVIDALIKKRK